MASITPAGWEFGAVSVAWVFGCSGSEIGGDGMNTDQSGSQSAAAAVPWSALVGLVAGVVGGGLFQRGKAFLDRVELMEQELGELHKAVVGLRRGVNDFETFARFAQVVDPTFRFWKGSEASVDFPEGVVDGAGFSDEGFSAHGDSL